MNRRTSLLGPALLPFWLVVMLPIAASLLYALLYSLGLAGLLAEGWTLRYWRQVFSSGEVWASFLLSAWVAALVVIFAAGIALFLALRLRRELAGQYPAVFLYLPLVLPGIVAAFVAFQLLSGAGLAARVLAGLGWISGPGEMPELVLDPWALGIIITHTGLAIPFLTLLFHQLYQTERLAELARLAVSLGASPRQTLLRVEIPILLRAAASNLVLLFVVVLGSYEIPLILGRQSPQMLSVLILRQYSLFDLAKKPEAYALALLYTLIVILLLKAAWRRQGLHDES